MGACHPTRALRDEHMLIIRVVDALERMIERRAAAVRAADARDFVDFFRLFTDALHHGKEEDLLFEALAEQGFPKESGPIAHMIEEHRLGRSLVRRMAAAADAVGEDPEARASFDHAAHHYIQAIRLHILKEDHALFEMADGSLDEPACRRLCDQYDAVCARSFEGRTRAQLEELGESLVGRFPDEVLEGQRGG